MPTLYNTADSTDAVTAVGGAAPSASDTVIFSEPGPSLTGNLAGYVNALTLFHETRTFTGDIGTTTDGLDLDATTVRLEGSGTFGHFLGTGSTWTNLYVDPGYFLRRLIFETCTAWTTAALNGGVSSIKASIASIGALYANGGEHTLEGVTGTNAVTSLTVGGMMTRKAVADLWRKVTTLSVGSYGQAKLRESYISPTTINLWPGGRLMLYSMGTVTNLNTYAGSVIDLSKLGRDITITNWTVYGPTTVIRPRAGISGWHESDVVTTFSNPSGFAIDYKNAA